jgi:hypothetical protein
MNLCISVEDLGEFYQFIDSDAKHEITKDDFINSIRKVNFKIGGLSPLVVNGVP